MSTAFWSAFWSGLVGARWQGPIPPPALIQQYNQVVDNGAERIMLMAEKA